MTAPYPVTRQEHGRRAREYGRLRQVMLDLSTDIRLGQDGIDYYREQASIYAAWAAEAEAAATSEERAA